MCCFVVFLSCQRPQWNKLNPDTSLSEVPACTHTHTHIYILAGDWSSSLLLFYFSVLFCSAHHYYRSFQTLPYCGSYCAGPGKNGVQKTDQSGHSVYHVTVSGRRFSFNKNPETLVQAQYSSTVRQREMLSTTFLPPFFSFPHHLFHCEE